MGPTTRCARRGSTSRSAAWSRSSTRRSARAPSCSGGDAPHGRRRMSVYGQSNTGVRGSRLTAVAYCDRGAIEPHRRVEDGAAPGLRPRPDRDLPARDDSGGRINSAATVEHEEIVVRLERSSPTQWLVTMGNVSAGATTVTADRVLRGRRRADPRLAHVDGARAQGRDHTGQLSGEHLARVRQRARRRQSGSSTHFAAVVPFGWIAATTTQWVVTGYNLGDLPGSLAALAVLPSANPTSDALGRLGRSASKRRRWRAWFALRRRGRIRRARTLVVGEPGSLVGTSTIFVEVHDDDQERCHARQAADLPGSGTRRRQDLRHARRRLAAPGAWHRRRRSASS